MKMRKKVLVSLMTAIMMIGLVGGCISEETTENKGKTEVLQEKSINKEFVLKYPEHMQKEGFVEPVVLEKYPETIVTLSTYPVLTLMEMDVKLAAVPSTKVIEYPEGYEAVVLPGMMSEKFDIEQVISMEPDLVIVPSSVRETYEEVFEVTGIPVYYVAMTSASTDVYSLIKEQTQSLVDAFSVDEESTKKGEAVMAKFEGVEKSFEEISKYVDGKKVLAITVSGEKSIYLNKETSTLGCMLSLCGFENVCATEEKASIGHSMNQLDMEEAIDYDPDVIFITGSGTLEENKAIMDKIYKSNPKYWDSIEAFKKGDVFYLPSSYVSTAGINIISNIDNLIKMIVEKYNW